MARPTAVMALEPEEYKKLQSINAALFGDGTHLTPDQRRDLAEKMRLALNSAVFLQFKNMGSK